MKNRNIIVAPEIREAIQKADQHGFSLSVNDYLDKEHQDSLWYGGIVATAVYGSWEITIAAIGDVKAELTDNNGHYLASCRDKNNGGAFYEEMHPYLKSDKDLRTATEDGRLDIIDSNWFEWRCFDTKKNEYIGPDAFDNIFDSSYLLDVISLESLQDVVNITKEWEGIV